MYRTLISLLFVTSLSFGAFAADEPKADAGAKAPATKAAEQMSTPTTTRAAEQLAGMRDTGKPVESSLVADAPLIGDFVMGKEEAPITMIEYASLTCPHCAHFHNKYLPTLKEKYIDTGKMNYILRPYPLNEPALKAALLVDCIGEKQGTDRYYLFARVLFDSQTKWAFEGNYMNALETFANVGGVDKAMFNECIGNPERELKILNAKKAATDELKIPHTPYFFINGMRYEGDRSIEGFETFIEEQLKKKKK